MKKKIEKADDDIVKIGRNIKLDEAEEDFTEISKMYKKLIDGWKKTKCLGEIND